MAVTFPSTYVISPASNIRRQSDATVSFNESGFMRTFDFSVRVNVALVVVCQLMTTAEADSLDDFLYTNRNEELDVTISGSTYRVRLNPRETINRAPDQEASHLWTMSFGTWGYRL